MSAATEVGNNCVGNTASEDLSLTQLSNGPGGLPVTVPTDGVITKWKVNVITFPGSLPEQLRVLRGSPPSLQTVAESSVETVVSGSNAFAARIPVQAGDRVGVHSTVDTIFCVTDNPGDTMGVFEGNATVGSTNPYESGPELAAAVSAIVEPDADGDGYGDETQDKCPQSKATQAECPVIALSSFGLTQKGSALILVTASSVTVTGTVSLPKAKGKGKG